MQRITLAVNNQYNYNSNIVEYKYTDNTTAYTILKDDPTMLSNLTQSSPKIQSFYNIADGGNIGQIYKINNLMLQHDYNAASVLNNTFAPANLIEQNKKAVNGVYLNTWANGNFIFTSAQYSTLYNIAIQNPMLGGNAVYSARVMLGIDVCEATPSVNRTVNPNNNSPTSIVGKIYPNPVTGIANIDYSISSGTKITLTIFGIAGNKLSMYALNKDETHFSFSTAEFNPGIYFYQLKVDSNVICQNKFLIIK